MTSWIYFNSYPQKIHLKQISSKLFTMLWLESEMVMEFLLDVAEWVVTTENT